MEGDQMYFHDFFSRKSVCPHTTDLHDHVHKSFTPGGEPVEEGVQQDRVVACVVGMGDRKGGTGEEG